MSNKEKVIEIIENAKSIRFDDLWAECSEIFIEDLFRLLEELIKEDKIELKRNGIFEYYYIL